MNKDYKIMKYFLTKLCFVYSVYTRIYAQF